MIPINCVACIHMMPSRPPTATEMTWHETRMARTAVWLMNPHLVPNRLMKAPHMMRLTIPQSEVDMPRIETWVAVAASICVR